MLQSSLFLQPASSLSRLLCPWLGPKAGVADFSWSDASDLFKLPLPVRILHPMSKKSRDPCMVLSAHYTSIDLNPTRELSSWSQSPGRKILHPKAQGDEGCQKPTVSLDKDMGQWDPCLSGHLHLKQNFHSTNWSCGVLGMALGSNAIDSNFS